MTRSEAPTTASDAAWVKIETPLSPMALAEFCRDLERLYRINPYLEFKSWQPLAADRYRAQLKNLSNSREIEFDMSVLQVSAREFVVHYARGIKSSTRFTILPAPIGSALSIVDDYGRAAQDQKTDEVDRSLHAWGVALHEYLYRERRWGWCAPWRWYMRRVWIPMKPAARRITFVVLMVTLAEVALIALVMAIYWLEYGR